MFEFCPWLERQQAAVQRGVVILHSFSVVLTPPQFKQGMCVEYISQTLYITSNASKVEQGDKPSAAAAAKTF